MTFTGSGGKGRLSPVVLSIRLLRRLWAPLRLTNETVDILTLLLEHFEIALPISKRSRTVLTCAKFSTRHAPIRCLGCTLPRWNIQVSQIVELGFVPQADTAAPGPNVRVGLVFDFLCEERVVAPTGGGVPFLQRKATSK